MVSGPITLWQIDGGKKKTMRDFIFMGSKITADSDCSHEIKNYDKNMQHIKKKTHDFANKCLYSQSYGFSSSHIWAGELDHKEG